MEKNTITNRKISGTDLLSLKERREIGKALRRDVPFSGHGEWVPAADRPDPLDLLQAQDEGRLQYNSLE